MPTAIFRRWFQNRLNIADTVLEKFGKEGEPDAELIMMCATSALAAIMWPGERKDRTRFVEFLIKFAPLECHLERISVCLLIQDLDQMGEKQTADQLISHFFSSWHGFHSRSPDEYGREGSGFFAGTLSPILSPQKIDVTETDIVAVAPRICKRLIRKFSYASVLYSSMRNGLVHEYELSGNVSQFGWHREGDMIEYVNVMMMPDEADVDKVSKEHNIPETEARDALSKVRRSLYFPYRFIRKTVVGAADAAFDYWDAAFDCQNEKKSFRFSQPDPSTWWTGGDGS